MGALNFRKPEMKIANNVKLAEALNTLLLNVAGTVPKVCMQFLTPRPLGRYFPFCSYVELCLRPLRTGNVEYPYIWYHLITLPES